MRNARLYEVMHHTHDVIFGMLIIRNDNCWILDEIVFFSEIQFHH